MFERICTYTLMLGLGFVIGVCADELNNRDTIEAIKKEKEDNFWLGFDMGTEYKVSADQQVEKVKEEN